MAISFIPVRDQSKIVTAHKDSGKNKGAILKRLSTGRRISTITDDVVDYRKVTEMKNQLSVYNEAIKQVSLGTSLFDTALSTYNMLEEYSQDLEKQLGHLKDNYDKIAADAVDKEYNTNYIKSIISSINSLISTQFDSTVLAKKSTDGTETLNLKVNFSGDYDPVDVQLKYFKDIAFEWDATWTTTSGPAAIETLRGNAEANATTARNNYKLAIIGIENLANVDRLAKVQKSNTTTAISALEDIDVQEEMMDLMQAQVLEELSTEALIKIKDSSKYIINLIRA